jgi:hypothetical protein
MALKYASLEATISIALPASLPLLLAQLWAGLVRMPYALEPRSGSNAAQYKSPSTAQTTEAPPNLPSTIFAAFSSQHSQQDARELGAANNSGPAFMSAAIAAAGHFSMAAHSSKSSAMLASGVPGQHHSHSTGNNNNSSISGRLLKSILVPQASSACPPVGRAPTRSKSVHFEEAVVEQESRDRSGPVPRIRQRPAGSSSSDSRHANGADGGSQEAGTGEGEESDDRPSLQDLIGKDLLDEVRGWGLTTGQ